MKLNVGKMLRKAKIKVVKRSPEILLVVGVGGIIISVVDACRSTLKLEDILDETKEEIQEIHMLSATEPEYSEKDIKKDLTAAYMRGAWKVTKLYAPSALGLMASIGCVSGGHYILKDRLNTVASAYNILDSSFKGYRQRVAEKIGIDEEKKLLHGVHKEEYEEVIVDKDGKEKVKKHKKEFKDPLEEYSPYAKIFDCGCAGWEDDPSYNLMFLRGVQQHATDKLVAEGWLCLNDVYEMLGFAKTKMGQEYGWVMGYGDDFVDFGIYNVDLVKNRDFINGIEPVIILDFNVDGYILDKI